MTKEERPFGRSQERKQGPSCHHHYKSCGGIHSRKPRRRYDCLSIIPHHAVLSGMVLLWLAATIKTVQGFYHSHSFQPLPTPIIFRNSCGGNNNFPFYFVGCLENKTRRKGCATALCLASVQEALPSSTSSLQDKTIPDLWKIVQDSNGVLEKGLKSRLKRKQDLIDYILETSIHHQHSDDQEEEKEQKDDDNTLRHELEDAANDGAMQEIDHGDDSEEVGSGKDPTKEDNDDSALPAVRDLYRTIDDIVELRRLLDESVDADIVEKIPRTLADQMMKKEIISLLPIQTKSFLRIHEGLDTVLQAPTGQGKTLAFVLPVLARLMLEEDPTDKQQQQPKGQRRGKRQSSMPNKPSVLVLAPSRELAQQVGREFGKFNGKTTAASCATVFGGVPIERHVDMLRKMQPQILVSTPGRLRELTREGHVDFSQISTLILDEADSLLDKADSPDVRSILENLETAVGAREEDALYQMILVSATVNQNVVEFAKELEIPPDALIRVNRDESDSDDTTTQPSDGESNAGTEQQQSTTLSQVSTKSKLVEHWHMACKSSCRPSVAADLISILSPTLTIIFVAAKTEAESVASILSARRSNGIVRVLHGDMAQSARSRIMANIRETALKGDCQVLVATDVASRGIDLAVDLVIQFGVPRIAGKEGTFSTDLYTHRTGRTGRVRSGTRASSNSISQQSPKAVMLYDIALGEGKLISPLAAEIQDQLGVPLLAKHLPSAAEVAVAAYERTKQSISLGDGHPAESDLISYFRTVLETEKSLDTSNPEELVEYLARSMALLSSLDPSISPFQQHASLLSGSETDRTLRFFMKSGEPVSPPEVIKSCKELGSGKLGRVIICDDGSAVFDLPTKRASKLLGAASKRAEEEWQLEQPLTLPDM